MKIGSAIKKEEMNRRYIINHIYINNSQKKYLIDF